MKRVWLRDPPPERPSSICLLISIVIFTIDLHSRNQWMGTSHNNKSNSSSSRNNNNSNNNNKTKQNNAIHDRWCSSIDSFVISICQHSEAASSLQMSSKKKSLTLICGNSMAGTRCCDHGFAHCLFGKLPMRGTRKLIVESCLGGQRCNVWSLVGTYPKIKHLISNIWTSKLANCFEIFDFGCIDCIDGQWISYNHKFRMNSPTSTYMHPFLSHHGIICFLWRDSASMFRKVFVQKWQSVILTWISRNFRVLAILGPLFLAI